jgi:hypothetical protein
LTETLGRVLSGLERLPGGEQDAIAHELQVRLEEREWDAPVRFLKSQYLLERLAGEARAKHDHSETRDPTTSPANQEQLGISARFGQW